MKSPSLLIALTVINAAILVCILVSQSMNVFPDAEPQPAEVLKGKSLEIVDDAGRVRASIKVHPAGEFKQTGQWVPETVVLRLIDQHGRPEVKIAASSEGGGITLIGEADTVQAMLHANGADSYLKVQDKRGKREIVKPK